MSSESWPPDVLVSKEQILADIKAWALEYQDKVGHFPTVIRRDPSELSLAEKYQLMGFGRPLLPSQVLGIQQAVQDMNDFLADLLQPGIEQARQLGKSLQEFAAAAAAAQVEYRSWRPNEQGYLKYPFDRWRDQLGGRKRSYEQFRQAKRPNDPRRNGNGARLPGKPAARNCPPGKYRRPYPEIEV